MPTEIVWPADTFTCERYLCKMSRRACVKRQQARLRDRLKGWKAKSGQGIGTFENCDPSKCAQGAANVAETKKGKG